MQLPLRGGFAIAPSGPLPTELLMMYFTSDSAIDRIGRGLIDRSLPKAEWTRCRPLRAALSASRRPEMHALRDMPDLIRAYNEATGVPNTDTSGYHATITMASLRVARAWLAARPHEPLHAALIELLASDVAIQTGCSHIRPSLCCSRLQHAERGSSRT